MVTNEQLYSMLANIRKHSNKQDKRKLIALDKMLIMMKSDSDLKAIREDNITKMYEIVESSNKSVNTMHDTVKILEEISKLDNRHNKLLEIELNTATNLIVKLKIRNNQLKIRRSIYKLEGLIAGIIVGALIYHMIMM